MNNTQKNKGRLLMLGLSIAVTGFLSACSPDASSRKAFETWEDVNQSDVKLGLLTGSSVGPLAEETFPLAKKSYYNNVSDITSAMSSGKLDAFCEDSSILTLIATENLKLDYVEPSLMDISYGFGIPKSESGKKLADEITAYIEEIRQNGVMAELYAMWFNTPDEERTPHDYKTLPNINGVVKAGCDATYQPFAYRRNGEIVGYEIELLYGFCEEYGYALDVTDINFDGLISSALSGKLDLCAGGLSITEERKESLYFSSPIYEGGVYVAYPAATNAGRGFFETLGESFEKTFIREDRYKMFLKGIGNTLLITIASIVFGTILGFAVFMACRKGNKIANRISAVMIWLLQGMPIVVLLMILYYLVFGNTSIDGLPITIIGFSLLFGSSVFSMLKTAQLAIDPGQYEAAFALGYSDRKAFFRIILPQMLPLIESSYKGEIVSLIKSTSMVGYIAVEDLTKIGDIVRSRTYDAFFPLVSVAIIYFLLANILTFLVSRVQFRFDYRKKDTESILKGVDTHDQN